MSVAQKLERIAENQQRVFDAGIDNGYKIGRQEEYDAFWDGLQNYGSDTTDYRYKFYYWNDACYNPKYRIYTTKANMGACYQNARITNTLVDIDLTGTQIAGSLFASSSLLVTIPKLIFGENLTSISSMFNGCNSLENLNAEGVIALNGLDLRYSPKLSKASWISIINTLSPNTSGLSMTGSLTSVQKAFETSEGANDGNTSAEWKTLTDTKKNWTISLV